MGDPFLGEIRMFGGNFAPAGWAFCDGQLLSIAENDALFNLIGTTYGGDGQETFALPDLRGRLPIHMGTGPGLSNRVLGEQGGTEVETLTVNQMPVHTHATLLSSAAGSEATPAGNVLAASPNVRLYRPGTPTVPLHPLAVAPVGGSQPHDNAMPFLCVNFIIALDGVFPSQT
ncbi:MAG: phage tail protein [Candidatus Rokuibacteriota bacterium]